MKYAAALLLLFAQLSFAQSREAPACGNAAGSSYCRRDGAAPTVVLLTGLGNSMQSWPASFVSALNGLAGVIVYDRRGHGGSAPLAAEPVLAKAAAADLDALLAAMRIREPVVLVAHSLGGLYAQYFARNYPRRESPPFPPVPLIVISASDHGSPKDFEAEWQRIQARTAEQSPLGRLVVAQGSGHDVFNDRPALVVDEVRWLLVDLRNGR